MRLRCPRFISAPFFLSILFLLGLMATPLSSPLLAQTNTTGLSGTVTDPSGALVPGAAIELSNPATGFLKVVKSGAKGEYTFDQILPAKYRVTVSAAAFAPQVADIELLVATPRKVDFKLTVGNTEVVDVAAGVETVNSTDATLGKAFDSAQVQNLPYLANNVNYLLSLQPGVLALDPGATTGGVNTDTRTGIVNGARQDQTNLTLDGVDNNDPNYGYAFVGVLRSTRESVQEFRVTTTNANADAGRSSGGQVSVTTRSGTNSIHGSAYEYYRDPAAAANNWFLKQTQVGSNKPNIASKVLQHTYGGSLGLPIIKNKLFFFGAYEGFKQATNATVTNTVPSILNPAAGPTLQSGSQTVGGLVTGDLIYPQCPMGNAGCTLAQAMNVALTPAQIAAMDTQCTLCTTPGTDAAAIAYFKQFPLANSTSGGDGYNTGSYTFSSPQPIHQITNVARVDYTLNDHQSLFVRGTLQSDNQASALQFPGQPPNSVTYGNNKGIAVGHIWSITNNLTNNFRYGHTYAGTAIRGAGAQPYVTFSSFSNLTSTTRSSIYLVGTDNYVDDATWAKGKHVVQFGINIRQISNSRYSDTTLYPTGSISASLLSSAAIAGTGSDLDPTSLYGPVQSGYISGYNNAILANVGGVTSATSYTNFLIQNNQLVAAPTGTVPTHVYHSLEQEYYVSDQWKVSDHLTLTGGLRYTYLGVPWEIHGQQVAPNVDLGTTFLQARESAAAAGGSYQTRISVVPGGQANGAPNLWTPQKLNFAPRLAFAYTPDSKTSIRGGFALAYDHFGEGVIDYYDANGAFALSRSNGFAYATAAGTARFTGYNSPPVGVATATTQSFPITPADTSITAFGSSFKSDINSHLKTPYAETFNLSVQREVARGLTITASYVGRLGRHVLDNLDVAAPTNLYDSGSNQNYFGAATAFDKQLDAATSIATIPNSGYFQNIFPNATYTVKASAATTAIPAGTYTGAKAYYASLAVDRKTGNETNTLYNFDTTTGFNPKGIEQFFYPQYTSIYVQSSVGTSNYNGLQLSARHTFWHGNEYDINYTFSKSFDYGSSPERGSSGTVGTLSSASSILNTFNPSQNYAPSDFDVRHNLTANYSLKLPFGKGERFFSNPGAILDRVLSGWQLNGTVHYSSGFPWNAVDSGNYGTNFDMSSYVVQVAPLATGGHKYVGGVAAPYETAFKNATGTLTTAAATARASFRYSYPGEIGQRNNLRADGYLSYDDGLSKSFRTYHEQSFKVSVEGFNVFNNVRFSSPTTGVASAKFGSYAGTLLTQPRQMQFSGKYYF
jgi:hypothetical protein